jgi:hypothetical protein
MRYARVQDGDAYQSLSVGNVAELGRAAQERREIAQEIVEQAQANGGIYSPTKHLDNLLDRAGDDATSDRARDRVDKAERLVESWASKPGTGITHAEGGDYEADVADFEKFMGKQTDREAAIGITDVNNVTLERGRDMDIGQEL